jgi:hypothetical protein
VAVRRHAMRAVRVPMIVGMIRHAANIRPSNRPLQVGPLGWGDRCGRGRAKRDGLWSGDTMAEEEP